MTPLEIFFKNIVIEVRNPAWVNSKLHIIGGKINQLDYQLKKLPECSRERDTIY